MKLIPTLDRVAIIREERKKKSTGGIILPCEKESNYGEVVAVGPGGFNIDGSRRPMSVKKGDIVFFKADYHTTTPDSKVVIVDDEDVLAIVK
ncbi:hypothetical protein LCGC14_0390340 [marine sediment metagenome]|uniref:10 kDa chaperonin n=1 Tax=marine sediment metagenome TaxID=412755 RepID=A0A0F9T5G5_9ZZZZ